jgi:hypothetical protein
LLSGEAVLVGPGEWQVELNSDFTATLTPGTYLFQAVTIGNETSVVVFAERTFTVSPEDHDDMSSMGTATATRRISAIQA